jgi:hypothetical protein
MLDQTGISVSWMPGSSRNLTLSFGYYISSINNTTSVAFIGDDDKLILNRRKSTMNTIQIEFKVDRKTWPTLDAEKERLELAQIIDRALKQAEVGYWTGSAQRRTSLIFHCMVKDELVARHTLLKNLEDNPLIRFLV